MSTAKRKISAKKATAKKAATKQATTVKRPAKAKPAGTKAPASKSTAKRPQLRAIAGGAVTRTQKVGAIDNVAELMAYAYAMELEAGDRYAEFADAMEAHNNREVAELFRKLSRIETRHSEQILEAMNWVSPPAPPPGGYRWEGLEAPESGDPGELHYLMQPYHALSIARHNEARAETFFAKVVRHAATHAVRKAAEEMKEEEAEHVRLIDDWLARTPKPDRDWAFDPDPPVLND